MRFKKISATSAAMVVALATHQGAWAQSSDADALMAMDLGSLRSEIQMRFDAALAATHDVSVVSADDSRHIWASEAKAQCGIALGYLKSKTKDPVSIGKCARAYALMTDGTRRGSVNPWDAPAPAPECENPALIFFEWNDPVPPQAEAQQVIDFVAANYQRCKWGSLTVVGHADKSGSNSYNMGLSEARANNVAGMLSATVPGVSVSVEFKGEEEPRVATEDGVRELQNRRVEIQTR